ncbi:hypothetical protein PAXRUDRAFT_825146 [Paxillus rubicundulus Ve08.2h10]|uniref:Uncharacterized protein n=1 Tax=Paxillus rubicundulus Ve08.2h10 TaxID=930991 RepID=A0A0D0E6S0_9AGAM|nr:hypothetical protein PAXRUDRAFT_825146 [Paxillus rubicundulus Ve08.2h10]
MSNISPRRFISRCIPRQKGSSKLVTCYEEYDCCKDDKEYVYLVMGPDNAGTERNNS